MLADWLKKKISLTSHIASHAAKIDTAMSVIRTRLVAAVSQAQISIMVC
jgi:hypothetical protein